jgi:hypothetical protein
VWCAKPAWKPAESAAESRRAKLDGFANKLAEAVFAAELGDSENFSTLSLELWTMYLAAVKAEAD